jgi:hypothetical protein
MGKGKDKEMNKHKWLSILVMIPLLATLFPLVGDVSRAQAARYFPETGHYVKGLFLQYWDGHGGLAQQGYPISEELQEPSDTDGKTYTVQYFERAVFEHHPENQAPYNVLLSLLGVFYYNGEYGGEAPTQRTSTDDPRKFTETGKTVGGAFRRYWEGHGGLAQQGYPISDEFQEISPTDGKTYTVQYFQRAVFEYHPELAGTANEVLLSLLGVFYYKQKHSGVPPTTAPPTVPPMPPPTEPPMSSPSAVSPTTTPVQPTGQVLFFKGSGTGQPALVDQQGRIFYQRPFQHNSAGWTHVVSVGGGYLIFYKQDQGGRVGRLTSTGDYQDLKVGMGFAGGWTRIAAVGNSVVVFFNSSTKKLETGRISADGSYTTLTTTTLAVPWEHMVGWSNGYLFFYLNNPVAGANEQKMTARVDSQGNFSALRSYDQPAAAVRDWVPATTIDSGEVVLYSSISGKYNVQVVLADGSVSPGTEQSLGQGYTSLAATSYSAAGAENDGFLAYRLDTGVTVTRALGHNGYNLINLKSYQGPDALPPGWTHVISVK